jgi:hypothetical protein
MSDDGPPDSTQDWLSGLIEGEWFQPCKHRSVRRRESTDSFERFMCLGCNEGMCLDCTSGHDEYCNGQMIQVFRCGRSDGVRVAALDSLGFDTSGIQNYYSNCHDVVYLRSAPRSTAKRPASFSSSCGGCKRHLIARWKFCSLECSMVSSGHLRSAVESDTSDGSPIRTTFLKTPSHSRRKKRTPHRSRFE